ncbi:Necrosis inducing protein [Phytophthora cactorum]|nr:Necrosis inducing protein [Phytophthora cactorum]
MNLRALATTLLTALVVCVTATVDYDKVEPFPQPEPATISENAVVKFKPQLHCSKLEYCVSYPTVNTAGEVTGGLKGRVETTRARVHLWALRLTVELDGTRTHVRLVPPQRLLYGSPYKT